MIVLKDSIVSAQLVLYGMVLIVRTSENALLLVCSQLTPPVISADCTEGCATCLKPRTSSTCLSCKPGFVFYDIFPFQDGIGVCQKCSSGCVRCFSTSKCMKCEEGYLLLDDACSSILPFLPSLISQNVMQNVLLVRELQVDA